MCIHMHTTALAQITYKILGLNPKSYYYTLRPIPQIPGSIGKCAADAAHKCVQTGVCVQICHMPLVCNWNDTYKCTLQ